MLIRLLKDGESIRKAFENKFLMTWPVFQVVHKDFIARQYEQYHLPFDQAVFDRKLMWDRMPPEYPTVSFRDALALLRTIPGEVQFLSEGPNYPHPHGCGLRLNGQTFPHFVAAADARELANLIEFEWLEEARLFSQMRYMEDKTLPDDLYICTPDLTQLIVFTHETTNWELEAEDPINAAESRLCIAFGFDQ